MGSSGFAITWKTALPKLKGEDQRGYYERKIHRRRYKVIIWWWWRLFPSLRGLLGEGSTKNLLPALFFPKAEISWRAPIPLQFSISPQWLSELRRLWTSAPWRVARELVFLIGSYTMPEQHSQSTLTSLGRVCMRVYLQPATRIFGRMTFLFTCHCDYARVEQTRKKSQQRVS